MISANGDPLDVLVVGAGPTGLTLAVGLATGGLALYRARRRVAA